MWRIWQMVDPKQVMVILYLWLFLLAFMIHFILLSTERYNWLENPRPAKRAEMIAPSPDAMNISKFA
jgi:light-harvesting complex 1 alpha chain